MYDLQKLLDQGYAVSFGKDEHGYTVNVDGPGYDGATSSASSVADALTGALPDGLADDEPEETLAGRVGELEERVDMLDGRTDEDQGLLIRTLADTVRMLDESGIWKPGAAAPEQHVKITVTCDSGHVLGTWTDKIEEKYPFSLCEECDSFDGDADKRTGKYPWVLTTEIIAALRLTTLRGP